MSAARPSANPRVRWEPMKQSLLVELHTEELPPKALKSLADAFAAGIAKGLRDRQLPVGDSVVTAFGAPRRLAVHITHVAASLGRQAVQAEADAARGRARRGRELDARRS